MGNIENRHVRTKDNDKIKKLTKIEVFFPLTVIESVATS